MINPFSVKSTHRTMDGRNARGQRVSLLNDEGENSEYHRLKQLGRQQILHLPLLSVRSNIASSTSTPVMSPSTPDLIRSQSTDSAPGQSPSPMTPNFHTYPFLLDSRRSGSPFSMSSTSSGAHKYKEPYLAYPPLSSTQLPSYQSASSGVVPLPVESSASSLSSLPLSDEQQESQSVQKPSSGKKNSYPCPLAKQLGCTDLFTTSGHAARHAKKHTGKKDALCPECNKAFTRKDNMEQHRRTHRTGRSSARTGVSARARSKVREQQVQRRTTSVETATTSSRCASSGNGSTAKSAVTQSSKSTAQPVPVRSVAVQRNNSLSLAPGLETLAIVATVHS